MHDNNALIHLPLDRKEQVIDETAGAVVHDNSLLSFAYRKTGFVGVVNILIETGQSYSAANSIDLSFLLPTEAAVLERVMHLHEKRNRGVWDKMNEILHIEGMIS